MSERPKRFEQLQLLPGQVLQLEFEGSIQQRDRSTLVGYSPRRSIIVTTPKVNNVNIPISREAAVNVRLFSSRLNGACAFRSKVIHTSLQPFAHMHLSMPESIELGEVRKSVRAQVELIASVRCADGERYSAIIRDLSADGARLFSKSLQLDVDEECTVLCKCSVSEAEHVVAAPAVVRSVQWDGPEGIYGLQFCDIADIDRIALYAYVLENLQGLAA